MTKEQILKVATQEFSKYGYDGLSMNTLASKLDINKATIYYYYKDKESLYHEVLKRLLAKNKELTKDILQSELSSKERFKQYIKLSIQTYKENPEIIPITLREMANFGLNIEQQIAKEIEEEVIYMKQIVDNLDLKPKYKNLDIYTLKGVLIGTINSYYTFQMSNLEFKGLSDFHKNSDDILEYLGDFISNILLDALCKES